MLEKPDNQIPDKRGLAAYLETILHVPIELEPWESKRPLPVFMTRHYNLSQATIAGQTCIFLEAMDDRDRTPTEIRKHISQLESASGQIVVFVPPSMRRQTRGRLIEQGIAFAVPGNQLYIPQLAMDLREHFRVAEKAPADRLTPAAQVVLFHHLIGRHNEATPSVLARQLPYTAMTIGRAFDELSQHNLATIERAGREKTIVYPASRPVTLEHAKTLLRTPRRGYHAVSFTLKPPPMLRAGESALADLTNLAPPATPVYAIEGRDWHTYFANHGVTSLNEIEGANAMIETWYYDPHILAESGRVDRASLFAQFWNDPDERVEQAAIELLETFE